MLRLRLLLKRLLKQRRNVTETEPVLLPQKRGDVVVVDGEATRSINGKAAEGVPWTLDVASFLEKRPMPPVFPGDADYLTDSDGYLRYQWMTVFLDHPNPDVVVQCLRLPDVCNILYQPVLADLLVYASSDVRETVSVIIWGSSDSLEFFFNTLFSRGLVASGYPPPLVSRAASLLRAKCPAERASFLEEQIDK